MGKQLTKHIDDAMGAINVAITMHNNIVSFQDKLQAIRDKLKVFEKQQSKKIDKMFTEEIHDLHDEYQKTVTDYRKDKADIKSQVTKAYNAISSLHAHCLVRDKKRFWVNADSTKDAKEMVKDLMAMYKKLLAFTKKL